MGMNCEIATLLKVLKDQVPGLRLVMLFGSFADDRQRPNSDIDIAFAAKRPLDSRALFDLKLDLQTVGARRVDLIDLGDAAVSLILKHEIIATGKAIFEADNYVLSEYEGPIFRDYHDFIYRRREIDNALTQRLSAYANG
jgi:uncharacterized protein